MTQYLLAVAASGVPVLNYNRRKIGGIWFIRLGRFQMSFCVCRNHAR